MRALHASFLPGVLIGLLVAPLAVAQADKVDALVSAELARQRIPGVSIAVMRDGKIVKAQGYGLANVEHGVAASAETIYQTGSVGKQFTATLVMMLVEEGKLSLDDSIDEHFRRAPQAWRNITVRHLLTHTSGISNSIYDNMDLRRDFTDAELLELIAATPLDFAPGERFSYSNAGYVLLGILIHRVTGEFYGDLLREKVFEPIGMTTARVIDEAAIVPHRAAGYRLVEGELKNQEWVSPSLNTLADGALYVTVLDMAAWDAALYTDKLLEPSSLELMWTPVRLNDGTTAPYGFGWVVGEASGPRVVLHGGVWQGFSTLIARYLDKKLTVVVLANLTFAEVSPIALGIVGLYEPELASGTN
jgi:CubicO group peptidase (beta-lactamase class C family)